MCFPRENCRVSRRYLSGGSHEGYSVSASTCRSLSLHRPCRECGAHTSDRNVIADERGSANRVHGVWNRDCGPRPWLSSGTTASHIHCCLPTPFATGVNVGVATTTPTFLNFPLGVLSGTYDMTFDLSLASSYNPAFVTLQGSLANAENALISGILGGLTYFNVHTVTNPGGEIRGFLAVPEPQTYAMLLAGFAVVGFAARRKGKTLRA